MQLKNCLSILLCLLLFTLAIQTNSFASDIIIRNGFVSIDAMPSARVYKDKTMNASVIEVKKLSAEFEEVNEPQYNAAFEKVHYWFHNKITNQSSSPKEIIYDVSDPHVNELELFVFHKDTLVFQSKKTGDFYPFPERDFLHRTFNWPFDFGAGESYDFYLKVNMHTESILIPVEIWDSDAHRSHMSKQSLIFGVMIGLLVLYLFSALILWILYREYIHLYFLLYVLSNFILILGYSGIGFQYLWQYASIFQNISRPLFAGLTTIAFVFLSNEVLTIFQKAKLRLFVVGLLTTISLLILILPFYREVPKTFLRASISTYYFSILTLLSIIFVLIVLRLIKKNDFESKFFLTAFLCIFFGFGINILVLHDLIPKNHFTSMIYYYTVLLELFIFLWYMSIKVFKIKLDNQKKEIALAEEKNKALQNLVIGTENERNRIATELHDGVGIDLAMADMKLKQIEDEKDVPIKDIRDLVQKVGSDMRNISHQLSTVMLKKTGLTKAVQNLALKLNETSDTRYFVSIANKSIEGLEDSTKLHLFRIIQEAIKNIEHHANATKAFVSVHSDNEEITIVIRDNGIGISNIDNYGIGIENMKSRASLINADLEISSKTDKGCLITVVVKVEASI